MDTFMIECREKDGNAGSSPGNWSTVLQEKVTLEEGDTISVKSSFIDTKAASQHNGRPAGELQKGTADNERADEVLEQGFRADWEKEHLHLRHQAYFYQREDRRPALKEKKDLADKMGHFVAAQELYKKQYT